MIRRNEVNGDEVEGSSRSSGHRIRPLAQSLAGWATVAPLRKGMENCIVGMELIPNHNARAFIARGEPGSDKISDL